MDQPHRRYNPLTDQWILVSPHRLDRPWQGQQEPPEPPPPAYDPGCYLCPGNARMGGARNPDYQGVYVFPNDFAALLPKNDSMPPAIADDPLFQAQPTSGECRVMCFSPDHGQTMPQLTQAQMVAVIECWATQTADLGQSWPHVQIFENKGAAMGCSNPHPHGQIWATQHLPDELATEGRTQSAYAHQTGGNMLYDLALREAADGARTVAQNADWLAIIPFWAGWPFEVLLLPRFAVQQMPDLDAAHRTALASILRELTIRYDNLFQCSFPYSMGWHGAPFGTQTDQTHWQLHAHFYPPLLRSAAVRKFMVGYELMAETQRDLTPEKAAEMLRAQSPVHYLQGTQ